MSTEQAIEECLERIDHTRALLESQLTELLRLCKRASSGCYDLHGLSGHMLGMAIVTMRLNGANDDDMKTLLNLTLEG